MLRYWETCQNCQPGHLTFRGLAANPPGGSAPNTLAKFYSISAEVEIPQGGTEGMLNTIGGRFGGYGLYVLKGKPVFTYNLLGLERFRLPT